MVMKKEEIKKEMSMDIGKLYEEIELGSKGGSSGIVGRIEDMLKELLRNKESVDVGSFLKLVEKVEGRKVEYSVLFYVLERKNGNKGVFKVEKIGSGKGKRIVKGEKFK